MGLSGLKKEKITDLLGDDNTFATVLLAICIDAFGTECFEWDPDVLILELEEDYNIILLQVLRDKINAGLTILTGEQFYTDPIVFWQIGNVLSGTPANWQSGADPLTVDEAAWAAVEAALLDAPDGNLKQPSYSPEVAAMIGAVLAEEGFVSPPKFLKFAKLPPRPTPMDLESEQAQASRTESLEKSLVEEIQLKLVQLNLQLQKLPFVEQSKQSDSMSPRDFLGELLSSESAPLSRG